MYIEKLVTPGWLILKLCSISLDYLMDLEPRKIKLKYHMWYQSFTKLPMLESKEDSL